MLIVEYIIDIPSNFGFIADQGYQHSRLFPAEINALHKEIAELKLMIQENKNGGNGNGFQKRSRIFIQNSGKRKGEKVRIPRV